MMANVLITAAMAASITAANEKDKLRLTVETICSDKRVLGMWGTAQTTKQKD